MAVKRNRNMCVKIAKDVLKQLQLGRYSATSGTYVIVNDSDGEVDGFSNINLDDSFKKVFKNNKNVSCEVCALGSAFVSLVNIENKCSVNEMMAWDGMFERLEKYFGNENIVLMESAFECCPMNSVEKHDDSPFEIDETMLELAAEWGERYDSETKRLRAIMFNVIRNKGDFKLPKKLVAATIRV